MERKLSWHKGDLIAMIGLPESGRLEFKDSRLMEDPNGKSAKIAAELTKEASAFANSEGGILVIGMRERKEGMNRVADGLDGVSLATVGREWLQNLIEGNLSPYLPGIRVFAVRISDSPTDLAVFVVDVPKGTTAYQASDKLYYGRSEFQCKALPDHEIRLRMNRVRSAQAQLAIDELSLLQTADQKLQAWQEKKEQNQAAFDNAGLSAQHWAGSPHSDLMNAMLNPTAPDHAHDYFLSMKIRNTGEITIRDFLLRFRFEFSGGLKVFRTINSAKSNLSERFEAGSPVENSEEFTYHFERLPDGSKIFGKVFPASSWTLPDFWDIQVPTALDPNAKLLIVWSLHLDDSPSIIGEIDLLAEVAVRGFADGC